MDKRWFVLALAAVGLAAGATPAAAQTYPSKPVNIVIGFAPGGPTDTIARLLASHLTDSLKQQFLVENKPGAASNIASDLVAKSKPDGYTLTLGNVGSLAVNDVLYSNLTYSPERDFTVIAMTGLAPQVLVVEPKSPAKTLAEFVAFAKTRKGDLNYASPGVGIPPHMWAEMVRGKFGFEAQNVQYKSGSLVIDAVTKGEVQFAFDVPLTVAPQHNAGKLRALAVTSPQRWSTLPDVPTFSELGHKDLVGVGWFVFAGPAGLPAPITEQLNAETQRWLGNAETKQKLANIGFEPQLGSVAQATAFIADERKRWVAIAKELKIKIE
jgi:tripartite-type tricarboxylate transporter receptor subunit TctC